MPIRIQRKRSKGWKMPPNTVYVGRGSRWGNPFTFANSGNTHPAIRFACEVAPLLDVSPLRGKNLACWCKNGDPCHGDILLELANPAPSCPLARRLAGYRVQIASGKGLLAREWDDMERLERHFRA